MLVLIPSGLAVLGALLAATYTHQGESPFSLAGAIGQLALAGGALTAAIVAHTSAAEGRFRRALLLAVVALAGAVAWWPVLFAVWEG